MNEKIERFPEGVLEHLSKTIGDSLTGTQISELIDNAGYPEKRGVLGTKWRYLYELFKDFNNTPNGQLHIAKIIQVYCDPTKWIGQETNRIALISEINKGLQFVRLQVNNEGKVVLTDKPIKLNSDQPIDTSINTQNVLTNPIFRTRNIIPEDNLCFILMPFKPAFDRIYKDNIKPIVWSCGFKCLRADDIYTPTPILEDIWICICKCKVIIADVTGRNANVFYEIGIAHTVGKPVIIITQDNEDIPFDIKQYRYFQYTDDNAGWKKLNENLRFALTPLISRKLG
jgi:hypothetical protein